VTVLGHKRSWHPSGDDLSFGPSRALHLKSFGRSLVHRQNFAKVYEILRHSAADAPKLRRICCKLSAFQVISTEDLSAVLGIRGFRL
jgi:hypothetical protein